MYDRRRLFRAQYQDISIIEQHSEARYRISGSEGNPYAVSLDEPSCTCPDWRKRQPPGGCKHILKVKLERDEIDGISYPEANSKKSDTQDQYSDQYRKLRKKQVEYDEYECQKCFRLGGPHGPAQLNVHHIKPRSLGGPDQLPNLITICHSCHEEIHGHRIPLPDSSGSSDDTYYSSATTADQTHISKTTASSGSISEDSMSYADSERSQYVNDQHKKSAENINNKGTDSKQYQQSHGWQTFQANSARTGHISQINHPTESPTLCWQFETDEAIISSPVVLNGTVYIGSIDGHLYAVDMIDGTQQWKREIGDGVYEPTFAAGNIYFGGSGVTDNYVYAVDATDGTKQWQFETDGVAYSSPTVAGSSVYVGISDSTCSCLYSLDVYTGDKQWQCKIDNRIDSSPAVANDTVYVGSTDNYLHAVEAATGDKQWQFETGGDIRSSPAVADNTVYIGSSDTNLYAVDAADGTKQWQFEIGDMIHSSPAVANHTVYIGSGRITQTKNSDLYAVDATDGTQQWQFKIGSSPVDSSPVVADETVYFGSRDGYVYAVDAVDSTKQWEFEIGDRINSSPAIANNTLYIGSNDKCLYAIR